MLEPIIKMGNEYKTLLANIMHDDSPTIGVANNNLYVFLDINIILSLACVLPLLKCAISLIRFVKSHEVYVVDCIEALKVC